MNDPSFEPLDPDVAKLLEGAAPYPDPPDHAKARVRNLLLHSILAGVGPGVGLPGGSKSLPAAPRHLWTLFSKPIAWVAAGFVAGTVTGVTVRGALEERPHERTVPAAGSATQSTAPSASAAQSAVEARPTLGPTPDPVARPAPLRQPVQASDGTRRAGASDLSAEQALLDAARAALVRGQGADALDPLERHAQRFPQGVLSEEREALQVNALVVSGRYAEARSRGEQFLARHPGSLLRPSVEAALEAIP